MADKQAAFIRILKNVAQNKNSSGLEREVAEILLNHDEPYTHAQDILQYGCIYGCVGPLIYYVDTFAFCDRHYHEIEELRHEFEDATGQPLDFGDALIKNDLAWFGFETITGQFLDQLPD